MHYVIAFIKDENNNLKSMAITLYSIIDYRPLILQQVYENICILVSLCLKPINMLQMMKTLLCV
jgi:hypothetical protein